MAELLGLSGVGVGGFGRGRDAGFSRGSGSGSVGVGVCADTVRTSVWVLVVEELWRGWLLARRFTYRG